MQSSCLHSSVPALSCVGEAVCLGVAMAEGAKLPLERAFLNISRILQKLSKRDRSLIIASDTIWSVQETTRVGGKNKMTVAPSRTFRMTSFRRLAHFWCRMDCVKLPDSSFLPWQHSVCVCFSLGEARRVTCFHILTHSQPCLSNVTWTFESRSFLFYHSLFLS